MPQKKDGEGKMKCKLCDKDEAENGYCELHNEAFKNIMEKYKFWKKGLEISWKKCLSVIAKNPLTGEYAKEVAEYLIKHKREEECN
jgi:hypothetical protein